MTVILTMTAMTTMIVMLHNNPLYYVINLKGQCDCEQIVIYLVTIYLELDVYKIYTYIHMLW